MSRSTPLFGQGGSLWTNNVYIYANLHAQLPIFLVNKTEKCLYLRRAKKNFYNFRLKISSTVLKKGVVSYIRATSLEGQIFSNLQFGAEEQRI